MKTTCENLDKKSNQLYLSVISLIKKEKYEKIPKSLPTPAIDIYWIKRVTCREGGNSLLLWVTFFFQAAKYVCSFKHYFEEEWAERWNFFFLF